MELRGHDDDSDGDDFLPHHRRLGLGRLYQESELGDMPPSSSTAPTHSSLHYNHSGIVASGSAFRRPPLFPSPLSSSTLPPSATPPSSHRQPQQHTLLSQGEGRAAEAVDDSRKLPAVQLPSSLDPNLSLVGDRPQEQQQLQLGDARKDYPDASTPKSLPTSVGGPPAEGGGGPSSGSRTEAAAATSTMPPSAPAFSPAGSSARYRECLKNHAARVGGHVLDGCGEFMPGGEDGTPEALKCAACTCHRSFHRKEVEGGEEAEGLFLPVSSASPPRGVPHGNPRRYYLPVGAGNGAYTGGPARGGCGGGRNLHNPPPLSLQTPSTHDRHHQQQARVGLLPPSSGGAFAPPSGVTALGGGGLGCNDDDDNTNYSGGTTTTESSSEEMQAHMLAMAGTSLHHGAPSAQASQMPPPGGAAGVLEQQYHGVGTSGSTKKRFRTKFTPEQKEMMAGFAERVGWRMQKQDDAAVEQFCREAGMTRQVFKVWMHNNKHALLKCKQPPHQEHLKPTPPTSHGEHCHHQQNQEQPQPPTQTQTETQTQQSSSSS